MKSRERVLDAAAHLIATIGLARTTTKEIARAAGYSEAMLYKLFRSKEELFMAVLSERVRGLVPALRQLPERVGHGTVRGNLETVAAAALDFYRESLPISSSLFAEPQLLAAHRTFLKNAGRGPQLANAAVAEYLLAEQQRARVPVSVDAEAVAQLLLGGCLHYAYLSHFTDRLPWDTPAACAAAIVATLAPLLAVPDSDDGRPRHARQPGPWDE